MVCHNCSATIPEGQAFCGKCGHKVTTATLNERLVQVEERLSDSQQKVVHQNYLEVETAEKVMSRVKKWTTLILYFAGIPAFLALLALAVVFGKGTFDLHNIAANAKQSVSAVLDDAKTKAADAMTTANDALATSKQVDADIRGTQAAVTKLRTDVEIRSAEVQKLSGQLADSQKQVELLNNTVSAQSQQVQRLTEQVRTVQTAKSVADVQNAYPIFGEHIARNQFGWMNPKDKPPDILYIDLNLSLAVTPNVDDKKLGDAITKLKEHKYAVSVGPVYTYARTPNSNQAIGMGLDANSCMNWPMPGSRVPCVIYFRKELRSSAMEVRDFFRIAQAVPDERVLYVDPARLDPQRRELLELSAMDIVVVLGQQ
jgi:hypothetical protein